ncbi:Utp14-domain-containing protein [Microstroma glucosiphilum]|uniref:Utp14-domain-containing protein n=1 Tax=Pseudomicrostroma glucosiphilum TaxID=1684307 RepID=A0A316UFS3_9BASI|nr:Utp14-domain-containing protein [Pseudomicrostroma glucosiphilum]PWN24099.1 Utp14-domain-containing protein [Pseudomicrostroma glucosiphilum]
MARRTGKAPQAAASSSSSHTRRRADHHRAGEAKGSAATTGGKAASSSSKPRGIHDIYDFAVEQHQGKGKGAGRHLKRVKAGNSTDDADSDRRQGRRDFDDEDASEEEEQPRRDQTYLEDSDDDNANAIAEEDDSDIDSDEAFAASDEERYEDVDFGKSSSKDPRLNRHSNAVDGEDMNGNVDDEEDEEEEEEEEEGMVDLSKMLDADGSEDADTDSGEEGDEGSDVGDDRLNDLASRYAQPSNKRSVQDNGDSVTGAKRQRRVLAERTEAVPESDFAAPSGSGSNKRALALEDFLAPLSNAAPGTHTALRNDTKALHDLGSSDKHNLKASRRGGGALSAPLPAVVRDRLQRAAGYDLSKEEAEKWQSTIKRLREAEHISFPLQGGPSRPKATTAQMSATFKPTNAFENEIEQILQGEGLSEAQINKSEELAMRQMDPAEVERRRDELRKMRDLMFRAEQKAKRVSKIKSKTYRKIARKDKDKERERLREAGVLDVDEDEDNEDLDGQIKAERDRAQERATLKHKNTGKWAKATLGRKDLSEDVDARQALNDQLQRSEQLRRRIKGLGDSSEDDSDSSDEDDRAHEDPRQGALDELRALDSAVDRTGSDNTGKKGVWNMKFMQDARNRDDAVADQAREELERELRAMKEDRDNTDDSTSSGDETPMVGRRKLGGQLLQPEKNRAAGDGVTRPLPSGDVDQGEDSSDEALDAHAAPARSPNSHWKPSRPSLATPDAYESPSSNPWLSGQVRSPGAGKTLVDKASSTASKSARKLEKRKSKATQVRSEEQQDAQLDIDPKAMLGSGGNKTKKGLQIQPSAPPAPSSSKISRAARDDDGADADSEDEAEDGDEPVEVSGGAARNRKKAISQRDLIAEAFAGDDVAAEFASEKARQIEADAPREVDTTLPGWGAWGGKGIKKSHKTGAAQAAQKKANMKLIPGMDASQRRDANMANVIINERRDKKAEKYKAKELPYPYTSAEQYEASLAQPLGQEWNTLTQNQRLTMPRVLKPKPGAVIKPIQRVG